MSTEIPNATLYSSTDIHGNYIQALVPFGEDEDTFFAYSVDDWSGENPQFVSHVFATTLRRLLESTEVPA